MRLLVRIGFLLGQAPRQLLVVLDRFHMAMVHLCIARNTYCHLGDSAVV